MKHFAGSAPSCPYTGGWLPLVRVVAREAVSVAAGTLGDGLT